MAIKILSMFVMIAMVMVGTLFQGSAAQTTHNVDWQVPSSDANGYRNWASTQSFIAGDTLVFNFVNGTQDVLQVTKDDFDSCSISNPLESMTVSPAVEQLAYPGNGYFICSFPGHCDAGQRLTITVQPASTTQRPSTGAASSISAIAIPLVLFFFAIGALFH